MPRRSLILVTGAPRTATTPVGNMVATAQSTVALYEPLGPTGLRRFDRRFPMLGEQGFDSTELTRLMDDLAAFRFGRLKKQQRVGKGFSWKRALIGSRTGVTLRLAQLQPWACTAIWKDPHAIFLAPDVAQAGGKVVVTARRAKAHAGSYRRLGWVSKAAEIYPRWAERYGRCQITEEALKDVVDPVISGALIWRLSYLGLIRSNVLDRVALVTSEALMEDECATYRALFDRLGLVSTGATERALSSVKPDSKGKPKADVTHDWSRSVAAANSYWKDLLNEEEAERVDTLTADIEEQIFAAKL